MTIWRRLLNTLRAALLVWRADGFIRAEDIPRLDNRKQWVRWTTEEHVNCRCVLSSANTEVQK